jgi:hypothetical protein
MLGPNPAKELSRLEGHHEEARRIVEGDPEAALSTAPHVSLWSPLRHVLHIALVSDAALAQAERILRGEHDPEPGGLTLVGRVVLATGWIPRGRARSPKFVEPREDASAQDALLALDRAAARLEAVRARREAIPGAPGRLRHFLFGGLTAAQWIRTAGVHTRHHLKIIEDIRGRY